MILNFYLYNIYISTYIHTFSYVSVKQWYLYRFTWFFEDASLHDLGAATFKWDEWDLLIDNMRFVILFYFIYFFRCSFATQITRHRPWLNQQFVTADYPAVRVEKRRVTRNSLWCRNNEPQYRLPDYKRTGIIELQMIPPVPPLALRLIFCFFVILRYDFSRWHVFNKSYDSINTSLILRCGTFYYFTYTYNER